MTRNAVGFYWTLPVPWAGFIKLPSDIDEAAKVSRTIRYQRDLIRRYAKEEGLELIHEEVFLELEPDRGSPEIIPELERIERICRERQAILLFVDFSLGRGWRSHHSLTAWASGRLDTMQVPAWRHEPSGFDPHRHFAEWRERQRAWMAGKDERVARAAERIVELRASSTSFPEIARILDAEGLRSATGKPWTAANAIAVLKAHQVGG